MLLAHRIPVGHGYVKLLVDGDILAYRAGYATERTHYLTEFLDTMGMTYFRHADYKSAKESGHPIWSRKEAQPEADAIEATDAILLDIRNRLEGAPKDLVIVLSGVGNFRHKIATRAEYKGNRSGERPKNYHAIREHLTSHWKAIVTEGEEADDRLGILMSQDPNSVCCSIDKDLMQVPGWHYNFTTGDMVLIDQRQGDLNFYAQVLSGDDVDNVPGLKGIGKAKAAKALAAADNAANCWEICLFMYREQFKKKGDKYALEAARLLHVRRKPRQVWSAKMVDSALWDISLEDVPSPVKPLAFSPITEEV